MFFIKITKKKNVEYRSLRCSLTVTCSHFIKFFGGRLKRWNRSDHSTDSSIFESNTIG